MPERHNPNASEMVKLNERLERIGGRNVHGKPIWRVVWGWDRLRWENGQLTANLWPNRFHLEKWFPPEHYGTPEQWAERYTEIVDGVPVETLGPYPNEGEYEQVLRLEGPNGGFLPLHPYVCEKIVRAMIALQNIPLAKQHQRREEEYERKRRATASRFHDMIDDRLRPFADTREGKNFVGYEPTPKIEKETACTSK